MSHNNKSIFKINLQNIKFHSSLLAIEWARKIKHAHNSKKKRSLESTNSTTAQASKAANSKNYTFLTKEKWNFSMSFRASFLKRRATNVGNFKKTKVPFAERWKMIETNFVIFKLASFNWLIKFVACFWLVEIFKYQSHYTTQNDIEIPWLAIGVLLTSSAHSSISTGSL